MNGLDENVLLYTVIIENVIIYMSHYTFYYPIYLINNIICIAGMYSSMSEILIIIHSYRHANSEG